VVVGVDALLHGCSPGRAPVPRWNPSAVESVV
jgi:hypothetical protein